MKELKIGDIIGFSNHSLIAIYIVLDEQYTEIQNGKLFYKTLQVSYHNKDKLVRIAIESLHRECVENVDGEYSSHFVIEKLFEWQRI